MFLILCQPRSRSAWLAHYLVYPPAPKLVGHDILAECESVEMFLDSYRNGMTGTIETAGVPLWRIVRQELPECKIACIRRPLIEVYKSSIKKGFRVDLAQLAAQEELLNQTAADPAIAHIPYQMLSDPFVGKWIFEVLLEQEFDQDWFNAMIQINVQVDMVQFQDRLAKARVNLPKVMEEVSRWPMGTVSRSVH